MCEVGMTVMFNFGVYIINKKNLYLWKYLIINMINLHCFLELHSICQQANRCHADQIPLVLIQNMIVTRVQTLLYVILRPSKGFCHRLL